MSKSGGELTITKLGGDEPPATSVGGGDTWTNTPGVPSAFIPPTIGGGRRRGKSTKTFPKGILRKAAPKAKTAKIAKIRPTRNPTKSLTRKVRISTEKGVANTRKRAHEKAAKAKISDIAKELIQRKIISAENSGKIPARQLRELYSVSVGAGLL